MFIHNYSFHDISFHFISFDLIFVVFLFNKMNISIENIDRYGDMERVCDVQIEVSVRSYELEGHYLMNLKVS